MVHTVTVLDVTVWTDRLSPGSPWSMIEILARMQSGAKPGGPGRCLELSCRSLLSRFMEVFR